MLIQIEFYMDCDIEEDFSPISQVLQFDQPPTQLLSLDQRLSSNGPKQDSPEPIHINKQPPQSLSVDLQSKQLTFDCFKGGLILSSSSASVPMTELHFRAKLIDVIGEVVIVQEYRNDSNQTLGLSPSRFV